jgi:hypothetical protein
MTSALLLLLLLAKLLLQHPGQPDCNGTAAAAKISPRFGSQGRVGGYCCCCQVHHKLSLRPRNQDTWSH